METIMSNFDGIKYFNPKENWGDASKISEDLLKRLDDFREEIGKSITVTCGTQGVHSPNSQHYSGKAVDCVFDITDLDDLQDKIRIALQYFNGVGVYLYWSLNGKQVVGFHFDVRTLPENGRKSTWLAYKDGSQQKYIGLNTENLKKYF